MAYLRNGLLILPSLNTEVFKIFVFGTLKKGFPNFYLNNGIKQAGQYITEQNYLFYLIGDRHTPCVYFDKNRGVPIQGELYHVNKKQLAVLDELERIHKPDGYVRTLVNIKNQQLSKQTIDAFIYLKMADQINQNEIKLGPIDCYTTEYTKLYRYRT